MKKKIMILSIVVLVIIGVVGFILWTNRVYTKITLDINPSVEINLDKHEKVKSVRALNDDAKNIVNNNFGGSSLDDALSIIVDKAIEEGYIIDGQVTVLLYSSGDMDRGLVAEIVDNKFSEKNVHPELIVIEKVTNEDKKIAKKYNISPAKASYINSMVADNEKLEVVYLANKSVRELLETKQTGKYCEADYELDGDFCSKPIDSVNPTEGMVCPDGYYDYNDTCYFETRGEAGDNLICRDEYTLDGEECKRTMTMDAEPVKFRCDSGEAKTRAELGLTGSDAGDANYVVCVDYSSATHPVTPCELPPGDPTERMSSGGRCYWHRAPVIAEGCPGKIQVAGECWDDATNIYICEGYRDGKQYSSKSDYCEHSIKYIDPVVTEYKCEEDGYTLDGNKCVKVEKEKAMVETICPSGYTLVDYGRCIDTNKPADKVNGWVCTEDNSRLNGDNMCVIYDIVDAKHS